MKPEKESFPEELLFDVDNVASMTECTGLMPTPPLSVEEEESYSKIYTIPQVNEEVENNLQNTEM